jgi:hypothetical protein
MRYKRYKIIPIYDDAITTDFAERPNFRRPCFLSVVQLEFEKQEGALDLYGKFDKSTEFLFRWNDTRLQIGCHCK